MKIFRRGCIRVLVTNQRQRQPVSTVLTKVLYDTYAYLLHIGDGSFIMDEFSNIPITAKKAGIRGFPTDKNSSSTHSSVNKKRNRDNGSKGLHIIIPAHDGHIYVIDGLKGCAERIDVGEHIYSMPLLGKFQCNSRVQDTPC